MNSEPGEKTPLGRRLRLRLIEQSLDRFHTRSRQVLNDCFGHGYAHDCAQIFEGFGDGKGKTLTLSLDAEMRPVDGAAAHQECSVDDPSYGRRDIPSRAVGADVDEHVGRAGSQALRATDLESNGSFPKGCLRLFAESPPEKSPVKIHLNLGVRRVLEGAGRLNGELNGRARPPMAGWHPPDPPTKPLQQVESPWSIRAPNEQIEVAHRPQ